MWRTIAMLLFSAAIEFLPQDAAASCRDPTECYCKLAPNRCEVLASAEVAASGNGQVTLRVLENPFYDPDSLISTGMELTFDDEFSVAAELEEGQRGLFRFHPPGACVLVEPDKPYLAAALTESSGTYPCDSYPSYPGTDRAALLSVVLGADCHNAAWQMIGIEHYCEGTSGCCYSIQASLGNALPVLLLGIFIVPGKRRSRH